MDSFIQEITDAIIDKYNKENNTNFKTYIEVISHEENKRMMASADALCRLYEITHRKGVSSNARPIQKQHNRLHSRYCR